MTGRYAGGVILAEVERSGTTEGYHHGSVVVLGADGSVRHAAGDVTAPIFPRSSNKPMQAVGMLRCGLDLTDPADLALAAASHRGEEFHVARVRAMLAAGGLTEADLACPPDLPIDERAREAVLRAGGDRAAVLMNCSGKHAAMLRTCAAAGWPTEGYTDAGHPLQKALAGAVEDIIGVPIGAVGVDGCGAPLFAMPLEALARAFLAVVSGSPGSELRLVGDAMRAHPELVSGTDGADTRLMRAVPGLLAKGGAEGVQAVALPGVGAVAVKIDDGGNRAAVPVAVAGLRRLGVDAAGLEQVATTPVHGGGRPVGAIRSLW